MADPTRYGQTFSRTYLLPDSSVPITLTSGAGADVWGAWTQLTAGIANDIWLLLATLFARTLAFSFTVQIGTGVENSEVVRWEGSAIILALFFGQQMFVEPFLYGVDVPANTRIAARCRASGMTAEAHIWVQYRLA